jgi:TFIIF-interacting CTD phosphatase-like protein
LKFLETEVEAVLFTTAHQAYVDRIMAKVDPGNKVFKHRVCQESCNRVEHGEEEVDTLVKDLGLLGRDLARVVLVDSKPFSFWSHPDNAYPLKEYRGGVFDEPDLELLIDSLRELQAAKDVRPILGQRFFVRDALRESNLL